MSALKSLLTIIWIERGNSMHTSTYIITYRAVLKHRTEKIEACSKYDAKQRFYRKHPRYDIVSITEDKEYGTKDNNTKK